MKTVETLQYILQRWHHPSVHPQVNRVVEQLKTCRTARQGYHLYRCGNEDCGRLHYQYHSCRNRHCPACGGFQKQQWIEQRTAELLPTHYFHVVFTLPHELNSIILGNRRQLFKLLFDASAATLLQFASDEKYLGAVPGILSVLHTWGQQLSFHPHLHCIVSSGGINTTQSRLQWKNARRNSPRFLFPVRAMGKVYRAKFLLELTNLIAEKQVVVSDKDMASAMIKKMWQKEWLVYAKKPFGGPQQVISYLGRYTHKTAITNQRIAAVNENEQTVTIHYKDYRDGSKQKTASLNVQEFIRRFEQHILPKGFTRIRYYGYLANRGRTGRIKLITSAMKIPAHPKRIKIPWELRLWLQCGTLHSQCRHCGSKSLRLVAIRFGFSPYNDS
jgi:hypothetical protein